jgi:SAM-dependent methyltransferase
MRSEGSTAIRLRRRGEYGFDGTIGGLLAISAVTAVLSVAAVALVQAGLFGAAAAAAFAFLLLLSILGFSIHTTRRGKFLVWREILDELNLRGDERVLDVGCGRGAVLTMLAERLARGRVVGIDLWTADQSGNGLEAAERNLFAEGVHERCEIVTGDMRSMPFPSASFDVVVSSLAVHNVPTREGRDQAIREIARVLTPGGRLAVVDLAFTASYAQKLKSLGLLQVRRRPLGWRFWWGPAVPSTQLVLAVAQTPKPASGPSLAQQIMQTR